MQTTLSTFITRFCISLFIQYSLVISFTVLPFGNRMMVQAQNKALPSVAPTTPLPDEARRRYGPTAVRDEKRTKEDALLQRVGRKTVASEIPSLAEKAMGFAKSEPLDEISKLMANKSSAEAAELEQEPRPTITPPTPGIGSGGAGPGGSFNVAPPERLQGAPPGVRSPAEVLSEAGMSPRIPAPIPSTESYCWPGDPACRKRPTPAPTSPVPKPTPPPRPQSASNSPRRLNLLVANNARYIEKLFSEVSPYLTHLWNVDASPYSLLTADFGASLSRTEALASGSAVKGLTSGSASFIWADCTYVEGYADGAQLTVYIYVDGLEVGTTQVEWDGYFIYDISAYVNDGSPHSVSAWYYDWGWNWLEAGSTSVSGCSPNYDFDTPRLAPPNETGDAGVNPGSQNINWSVPLVGLPGRGPDLNLLLTYNSLVWTKSADGAAIMFDADHGFPSPGFRLRFPIIQPQFFNSQVGVTSYMLVTSTGARIELRQVSANTYESADSSYMKMVDQGLGSATVWLKDGTQLSFSPSVNDEMRCTKIKDRNGNFISVTYTAQGNIDTVTDTLGRQIVFNYDANQRLLTITQSRTGLVNTLVTFGYTSVSFTPSFPGLTVVGPGTSTIPVLTQVGFPDGSRYNFEYTTFGQVNKIRRHEADNRLLSYVRYNLDTTAQSDCPRFSQEYVWAENWNNNQEAVTTYSGNVTSGESQVTTPDLVIHKQLYHTTGWRTGLAQRTETWSGGVRRKWTEMYWTQDNEASPYQVNPRPYDIRVFDEAQNQRRVTIDYTSYGLPANVREYSGAAVVRRQETQYRFDAAFVDRHILGVVWMALVYQGESTLMSKLNYHHDWSDANSFNGQTPATGHDTTNYGPSFVWGRANVTGIAATTSRRQTTITRQSGSNSLVITRRAHLFSSAMPRITASRSVTPIRFQTTSTAARWPMPPA